MNVIRSLLGRRQFLIALTSSVVMPTFKRAVGILGLPVSKGTALASNAPGAGATRPLALWLIAAAALLLPLDVLVRHLALIDVLDHGQVGALAGAKQVQLLLQERGWLAGETRVLALLAALTILTVAAGAHLIDFLAIWWFFLSSFVTRKAGSYDALYYFLKGKLNASRSALPSCALRAVVVITMSMPRSASISS